MSFEQTKELLPHQVRVVLERDGVSDNVVKLTWFTKSEKWLTVDPAEQERLLRQLDIMKQYEAVLTERINAF